MAKLGAETAAEKEDFSSIIDEIQDRVVLLTPSLPYGLAAGVLPYAYNAGREYFSDGSWPPYHLPKGLEKLPGSGAVKAHMPAGQILCRVR